MRSIFNLSQISSPHFFQTPRNYGGLGLAACFDLRACAVIAQVYRALNPDSSPFFEIFRYELCLQASFSTLEDALEKMQCPNLSLQRGTARFLSSGKWSTVVAALKHLRKSISISFKLEQNSVVLLIGKLDGMNFPAKSAQLFRFLRLALGYFHLDSLILQAQQGHSFALISKRPLSSHFYRYGQGVRFCDWKFVFPARLDLLVTRLTWSRYSFNNNCRRCQ